MMSGRVIHAGSGYTYLTRSVATNDQAPERGQKLSDYYAVEGTPAGTFTGGGLAALNEMITPSAHVAEEKTALLEALHLSPGDTVTEEHMAALFGEGLHPQADQLIAAGQSIGDTQLGRRYPRFSDGNDVLKALNSAEKAFEKTFGRRPKTADKSEIAVTVGRAFYPRVEGDAPPTPKAIIAFVNEQRNLTRQPTAGMDLTFSPRKSISVLWGLSDEETSSRIAALHHRAVEDTLRWVEDNALYSRVGSRSEIQVKTEGMIATKFVHFDTRGGDPDLHTHAVVANKVPVRQQDGHIKWLSLDSRAMHKNIVTASARYNLILQDLLTREMGLHFEAVSHGEDRSVVHEIAGIPASLRDEFSSRRTDAKARYNELAEQYAHTHSRQPSKRASYRLWQQAILDTREKKDTPRSLGSMRAMWREVAAEHLGSEQGVDAVVAAALTTTPELPVWSFDNASEVAREAVKVVESRRATWKDTHLATATSELLEKYRYPSEHLRDRALGAVMHLAKNAASITISPPEPLGLPTGLLTDNGVALDRHADYATYTSRAVLDAEDTIVHAAGETVAVVGRHATLDKALAAAKAKNGFELDPARLALAQSFHGSGRLLAVGIGPAGTGKTTAMQIVVDAWEREGHQVHTLAPTAVAAKTLGAETGTRARTVKAFTTAMPVVNAGDMILVDEAGMVPTSELATVVEHAKDCGAVVRLVGDPYQLDAIETGGMLRYLAEHTPTTTLDQVWRMAADPEQAQASLLLREGNPEALEFYDDQRGWISGGSELDMMGKVATAYLADHDHRVDSVAIAVTNEQTTWLNRTIRDGLIERGQVDGSGDQVLLRGDDPASVGDVIVVRKNTWLDDASGRTRVLNGQRFRITEITDTGVRAVDLTDPKTAKRTQEFDADFLSSHTHLGYAMTAHRVQGVTTERSHTLGSPAMDRASLYVSMTRAKKENLLYVITDPAIDTGAEHDHSGGDEQPRDYRDVVTQVLGNDRAQRAATQIIADMQAEASSDARRHALAATGRDVLASAYTDHMVEELLGSVPTVTQASARNDAPGMARLREAVGTLGDVGFDVVQVGLEVTDSIDMAEHPARLIAHRLRDLMPEDADAAMPPRWEGEDTELRAWVLAEQQRTGSPAAHAEQVKASGVTLEAGRAAAEGKPARTTVSEIVRGGAGRRTTAKEILQGRTLGEIIGSGVDDDGSPTTAKEILQGRTLGEILRGRTIDLSKKRSTSHNNDAAHPHTAPEQGEDYGMDI